MTTTPLTPGDTVRWWTKDGGWRFGHLASSGRIWARVQVGDRVREIRLDELRPWPPEYPDTQDTTPPARRVKRGRAA